MPPRIRTRVTKVLKENIDVVRKNKLRTDGKVTKPPRKALADKTNSLSDDNASIDIPTKTSKTTLKSNEAERNTDDSLRPKRNRRLPPRYVENQVLNKLSNNSPVKQSRVKSKSDTPVEKATKNQLSSKRALPTGNKKQSNAGASALKVTDKLESPTKATIKDKKQVSKPDIPAKNAGKLVTSNVSSKEEKITITARPRRNCRLQSAIEKPASEYSSLNLSSTFKTPTDLESSLVVNRPKRICRLPSKFEDHSISPSKFIPIQPCYASTPIITKTVGSISSKKTQIDNLDTKEKVGTKISTRNKSADKPIKKFPEITKHTKTNTKTDSSNSSVDKSSPDPNNNGKNKTVRAKKASVKTKLQTKQVSPKANKITPFAKRLLDKSLSFRILDDNRKQSKGDNLDVYEFTFDPNEEPPPQKKKRKRTVKKKLAKPKTVVLKSNYNDNVSKALAKLKTKVKPSQIQFEQNNVNPTDTHVKPATTEKVQNTQAAAQATAQVSTHNIAQSNNYSLEIAPTMPHVNKSAQNSIHKPNYASIRIEDIAADFEPSDPQDNLNYSPVNSPYHPPTPEVLQSNESHINPVLNNDPLNLQEDLSFFDEHPVASSSMNHPVQNPLASPWRVEFGSLPIKWHSNTYIKPNMTPAVECSFINSEEMNNKKHIYTNIVTDNEPLQEIVESNTPNLKQTSIISFMREAAVKSANKKKRRRSPSPTKANFIFDDIINTSDDFGYNTPKKAKKTAKNTTPNVSNSSNDKSNEKESSNQSNNKSLSPAKQTQKKKDKDCTYFGFDESENLDQENVSPVKNNPNTRTKGLRSRAVLQDFNAQVGPTRVVMPVAAKAKMMSSETVEELYDKLKSAEDVPQLPEQEPAEKPADKILATSIDDPSWHEEDDGDSQSVHLFEDIEVVHHLKHHQKSYGKAKKVTFQQHSDSDTQSCAVPDPTDSSDDDLADLSFHIPSVKQKKTKKKKPKKLLTKKEEKEVEAWAAGFNSMCEDIDEFPLVVE